MNLSLSNLKRVAPVPVLALAVLAAACGGGTTTTAASSATTAPAASGGGTGTAPPGVSGTVAAVNGTSLEVQGAGGQVTVNVTPSTVITQTVAATSADLAVGQCVAASGTKSGTDVVAATAVSINEITSSSGSCSGGFGGGGRGGGFRGGAGGGEGTAARSTTRSTLSAAQRARLANLGIAVGKVTTISGNTVDVQVPTPPSTTTTTGGPKTSNNPLPRVTPTGSFTFTSSTTFTVTKPATASSLAVNQCVTAFGPSNNTGAVTATRLTIRPPVNGSCSTAAGFGGRRGFFGGGGFGGGGGAGG